MELPKIELGKPVDLRQVLSDVESILIKKALEVANGKKAEAARLLGINRTTLIAKMKSRGLYVAASSVKVQPEPLPNTESPDLDC